MDGGGTRWFIVGLVAFAVGGCIVWGESKEHRILSRPFRVQLLFEGGLNRWIDDGRYGMIAYWPAAAGVLPATLDRGKAFDGETPSRGTALEHAAARLELWARKARPWVEGAAAVLAIGWLLLGVPALLRRSGEGWRRRLVFAFTSLSIYLVLIWPAAVGGGSRDLGSSTIADPGLSGRVEAIFAADLPVWAWVAGLLGWTGPLRRQVFWSMKEGPHLLLGVWPVVFLALGFAAAWLPWGIGRETQPTRRPRKTLSKVGRGRGAIRIAKGLGLTAVVATLGLVGFLAWTLHWADGRIEKILEDAQQLATANPDRPKWSEEDEAARSGLTEEHLEVAERMGLDLRKLWQGMDEREREAVHQARAGEPEAFEDEAVRIFLKYAGLAFNVHAIDARGGSPGLSGRSGCYTDTGGIQVDRAEAVKQGAELMIGEAEFSGDPDLAVRRCVDSLIIARELGCDWSETEFLIAAGIPRRAARSCLRAVPKASVEALREARRDLANLEPTWCPPEVIVQRGQLCIELMSLGPAAEPGRLAGLPPGPMRIVESQQYLAAHERFIYRVLIRKLALPGARFRDGLDDALAHEGPKREALLEKWETYAREQMTVDFHFAHYRNAHGRSHHWRRLIDRAMAETLARRETGAWSKVEDDTGAKWTLEGDALLVEVPRVVPWFTRQELRWKREPPTFRLAIPPNGL